MRTRSVLLAIAALAVSVTATTTAGATRGTTSGTGCHRINNGGCKVSVDPATRSVFTFEPMIAPHA